MSYTPPAGNAILLKSRAEAYTPPTGASIVLRPEPEGLQSAGSATVSFVGVAVWHASFSILGVSDVKGELDYRDVAFSGGSAFSAIYPNRHVVIPCGVVFAEFGANSPAVSSFDCAATSSCSSVGIAPAYSRVFEFTPAEVVFISGTTLAPSSFSVSSTAQFSPQPLADHVFSSICRGVFSPIKQEPSTFSIYGKGWFATDASVEAGLSVFCRSRATFFSYNPVSHIACRSTVTFVQNRHGSFVIRGRSSALFDRQREHVFWSRSYSKIRFDAREKRSAFNIVAKSSARFVSRRDSVCWMRGYSRVRIRS